MSVVTVERVRWQRGWVVPLVMMLIVGLGRPVCLLAQTLMPLVVWWAPLPPDVALPVLRHRRR